MKAVGIIPFREEHALLLRSRKKEPPPQGAESAYSALQLTATSGLLRRSVLATSTCQRRSGRRCRRRSSGLRTRVSLIGWLLAAMRLYLQTQVSAARAGSFFARALEYLSARPWLHVKLRRLANAAAGPVMAYTHSVTTFVDKIKGQLLAAGLNDAEELDCTPEARTFGDASAVFRLGSLLLRVTRERGQEFLDIAASVEPKVFHQFDDVDIAMGWKSVDEVLAKREPENIAAVLARVSANRSALGEAFSGDREHLTRARVERATRDRGQAFTDRLRGKKS